MKILHVLPSQRAEGTPRLVLDWLTVLQYEQEVLFLSPEGELKSEFDRASCKKYYNLAFEPSFRNSLRILLLVKEICEKSKPSLVIAWPMGFSHWIALGARLGGVKKNIAHAGNPVTEGFLDKYVHTIISTGLGRLAGNKVIACSDYVYKSFISIPLVSKKQVFPVYNCVQVERYFNKNTAPKTTFKKKFTMVATLEEHKDHKTLLEAWKIVEENNLDLELNIAGDGSLKDELQKMKISLNLKNVNFLGTVNDIPSLLWQSDVFIFSTTFQEGFGTVLIEALAAGCAIIATDVPACREVLKGGEYGKLVPMNDPTSLSKAIIFNMPEETTSIQLEKQKKYAAKFSPQNMIIQYLDIVKLNKHLTR